MNLVAESARPAVSAIALAAVAVSAILAMRPSKATPTIVEDVEHTPHCCDGSTNTGRVKLGPIHVVGSPSYETIMREVSAIAPELARCASTTTRVTLYAHVTQRHIAQVTAFGDDEAATSCVENLVAFMSFAVDEDVDLMIPIDLVK